MLGALAPDGFGERTPIVSHRHACAVVRFMRRLWARLVLLASSRFIISVVFFFFALLLFPLDVLLFFLAALANF